MVKLKIILNSSLTCSLPDSLQTGQMLISMITIQSEPPDFASKNAKKVQILLLYITILNKYHGTQVTQNLDIVSLLLIIPLKTLDILLCLELPLAIIGLHSLKI